MAHRDAGETQRDVLARTGECERRHAIAVRVRFLQRDQIGELGQFDQQPAQFERFGAIVERRGDRYRAGQFLQIGVQLGFEIGIEHNRFLA